MRRRDLDLEVRRVVIMMGMKVERGARRYDQELSWYDHEGRGGKMVRSGELGGRLRRYDQEEEGWGGVSRYNQEKG